MEKILRLLNPKTTNFDSVGGGSYGALTAQDVCAAISYAELSPVQSILLRLHISKLNQLEDIAKATKTILLLSKNLKLSSEPVRDETALYIALVEIFNCPADYKPSERNRAVIGSVSRMQIQRNLGNLINQYKAEIAKQLEEIESKIMAQLKITY
jgi:hypothetical protein